MQFGESNVTKDVQLARDVRSKTGRICDGYENPTLATVNTASLTLTRIANSSATSQEVRALQFFVERTAVQFGTFVPDDLWSSRVLQLAHSNKCIRHALVALSSYHERYWSRDVGGETPYGLRQYNLAISDLVKSGADRPSYLHIQLVSCTIFICIEILRRNINNAIYLFKYGCRMIEGAMKQARKGGYIGGATGISIEPILRLVEAFFARISTQVFLAIGGDIDHKLADIISPMLKIRSATMARKITLSSIQEARDTLLKLALQYRRDMTMAQSKALGVRFDSWIEAFDEFRKTIDKNTLNATDRRAFALLELHKRYLYINIAALNQPDREDPSMWDLWTDKFREMIEFAVEAGGFDAAEAPTDQQPQFYMEIGILPALFFLSAKCRDPEVRRRAIEIMESNHIQEGIWNSEMAAKVAKKVMALEEGEFMVKSSNDIDDLARVRRVAVHAGPEVTYLNIGYELHSGWVEEELD
ncbi:C6 zinc finger domain-containing protein [Pochonia chlamydosporia 170]|uniref:C6 zinc finger domain-containing protein n=1 Tax=Pochonia chlamydosporia 170 TaxID=1380566 RepID=A0A179FZ29_METCM|nr:C6 zinc finger domain-containing protein [Pochonia chlamydosporia 170]OAQ70925.2 C6 zinc finger domain-containing protein [Pochonia chlamydosporia 170]